MLDGLFGGGDGGFDAARRAARENELMLDRIAIPEYERYSPELYDNESMDYTLNSEDPALKSKQLEALARFEELGNEGLTAADKAGFMEARAMGDQMARAGTESAIQDAAVRGVGGSGSETAQREIANQEGARRAQEAALAQQKAQAAQRAQYLQAAAQMTGQVRDQDYRQGSANTNIINAFNQANTQNRNATGQANTDQRNDAFKYNQGLKDKTFQNQMQHAGQRAGMNTRVAEVDAAESAANQQRRRAGIGAVGSIVGGAFGGPAGAAIGGQAGNLF